MTWAEITFWLEWNRDYVFAAITVLKYVAAFGVAAVVIDFLFNGPRDPDALA